MDRKLTHSDLIVDAFYTGSPNKMVELSSTMCRKYVSFTMEINRQEAMLKQGEQEYYYYMRF